MPFRRVCLLLVLLAGVVCAEPSAGQLARKAKKAQKKGQFAEAYLLYSQAAAKAPEHPAYWVQAQALQRQAAEQAKVLPPALLAQAEPAAAAPDQLSPPDAETKPIEITPVLAPLLARDLSDVEQLREPAELEDSAERRSFSLRAPARDLFNQVAQAFGYTVVFDNEYPEGGTPVRVEIGDVQLRQALRVLETTTQSFVVPLGPKLFLMAKDTAQKRQELEPVMAITVPIPQPVSVQDAQELARSVQQAMEIQKVQIDSTRRLVLIRDRVSKVRPAELLLSQFMGYQPQVVVDVELMSVNRSSSLEYGLRLPTSFPLVSFGSVLNALPRLLSTPASIPAGFTRFLTFGGGATFLGLGIVDAQLLASMSRSNAQTLLQTQIRAMDGQPSSMHVGDKYPIATSTFTLPGYDNVGLAVPPTFQFEDLGVSIKLTPKVHGMDEVSLDIEAELKALGAESYNGLPVIASRKFTSKVRLRQGEWAVVAGLVTTSEAQVISGIAGLSTLPVIGPLFSMRKKDVQEGETLIVLKPRIVSLPSSELVTKALWTGSETRPLTLQ